MALAVALPGLWFNTATRYRPALGMTAAALCLIAYLLLEAAATHEALGLLRHELLKEGNVADIPSPHRVRTVNG